LWTNWITKGRSNFPFNLQTVYNRQISKMLVASISISLWYTHNLQVFMTQHRGTCHIGLPSNHLSAMHRPIEVAKCKCQTLIRENLLNWLSYKKCVRTMLMKLAPGVLQPFSGNSDEQLPILYQGSHTQICQRIESLIHTRYFCTQYFD